MQPDFTKLKPVGGQPNFATLKPVRAQATAIPTSTGFTAPLREGVSGLKTLYGGGEQGIAQKLVTDVKDAAKNIQTGFQTGDSREISKGILKGGARVAGDIATLFGAPIGTVIGATGIGKVFEGAQKRIEEGKGVLGQAIDFLADVPAFQEFAVKHPNAAEDFNRAMNLAFATQETGQIKPKTIIERTSQQVKAVPETVNNLRPTAETIATERQAKLNQGFEEQNTRLKSADKSFNKNTITRTLPDGKTQTITPIDTFSKYNIAPNIEKGSIQMGDYRTGTGQLGKIKSQVESLDNLIDTKLENTGQRLSLEALKQEAIKKARANDDFKQAGTVQSNINKLESRFEDYKQSYGDEIDIAELNNIRKTANKDYSPDTQDVSRVVGDTAREVVYEAVPNAEIKTLLQQQGELLAAKKYAETINGTKVTGGRLGNLALRTTGAVVGSSISSLPVLGPVIGAFGGEFAARALQQSQFKSGWTELRSLFQRSNTNQQSQSANTIPNNAINSKVPFLGQKVKLPSVEAGLSIKSITPELVAKNVDAYELGYIRDYLKTGSLKSFQKLGPLFEGTGIEAMDYKTLNRFLQEVINESTKKLDVKSNPAYTKGEQGRFTGSVSKGNEYLYHGTTDINLESIAKEGLKPGRRGQLSLSKTEDYAKSFAKTPDFYTVQKDGVTFRVKADYLKGKTTVKRVDGKARPMPDQINELLTTETIPPKYLEIFRNGKWQPLTDIWKKANQKTK